MMLKTVSEITLPILIVDFREEKIIEKKNEVPLVAKPPDHGKNLTKEQLDKTIKNAQSYTEMAKKLAASGKLVINSSKR